MGKGICFIGPMLFGKANQVKTQGEILADLLSQQGFSVYRKSTIRNKIVRFFDTIAFILFQFKKYDTLVIQVYGGLSFVMEDAASLLGKALRKRVIMTVHGGDFPTFMIGRERWVKRVLNRANTITAPSQFLVKKLEKYGIPVVEIPNIIDLSHLEFVKRRKFHCKILWMRAFHSIYNPELAIEVAKELRSRGIPFSLTMAGPDLGLRNEIEKMISVSGLQSNVKFLGMLDEEGKKIEGLNNDIYMNTNRIDNAPVSMIEMAALGLSLVSTNVGGIPYLFQDQVHCLLSESEDVQGMTENIITILENATMTQARAANAYELIKRFDWNQVMPQWLNLLN